MRKFKTWHISKCILWIKNNKVPSKKQFIESISILNLVVELKNATNPPWSNRTGILHVLFHVFLKNLCILLKQWIILFPFIWQSKLVWEIIYLFWISCNLLYTVNLFIFPHFFFKQKISTAKSQRVRREVFTSNRSPSSRIHTALAPHGKTIEDHSMMSKRHR